MVTIERLKQVLHYDPVTGLFTWRVRMGARAPAGGVAGSSGNDGKIEIRIDKRLYRAHRLAWLYMTGEWPALGVDHKDGDASRNMFSNLREATQSQNGCNAKRPVNNSSGVKGVYWDAARGMWHAQIGFRRRVQSLGRFESLEKAIAVRQEAASRLHGEFARFA